MAVSSSIASKNALSLPRPRACLSCSAVFCSEASVCLAWAGICLVGLEGRERCVDLGGCDSEPHVPVGEPHAAQGSLDRQRFGLNREAIQGGFGCEPDRGTAQLLVGDDRPDEHDAEARTDC